MWLRFFIFLAIPLFSSGIYAQSDEDEALVKAETERLYNFLLRQTPSHREALAFFRNIAPDEKMNARMADVLADPRFQAEITTGRNFYNAYVDLLRQTFGETNVSLRTVIDPLSQVRRSFDEWQKLFSSQVEKPISAKDARRLALQKLITLMGLPGDTEYKDLERPTDGARRLLKTENLNDPAIEELSRQLEIARDNFRNIFGRYQNLTDHKKANREPTVEELNLWKHQTVDRIDELRAKNFASALREFKRLHPSFELSSFQRRQMNPTADFIFSVFLGSEPLWPLKRASMDIPLDNLESQIEFKASPSARVDGKYFYFKTDQGFRGIRTIKGIAKSIDKALFLLPGYASVSAALWPGIKEQGKENKVRALYSDKRSIPKSEERVWIQGRQLFPNGLQKILHSLGDSVAANRPEDAAAVQFVNEALMRENALLEARNHITKSTREGVKAFNGRLKKIEKEEQKKSYNPQEASLTERLRKEGIDDTHTPLESIEWSGLSMHPFYWKARDEAGKNKGLITLTTAFDRYQILSNLPDKSVEVPVLAPEGGLNLITGFTNAQRVLTHLPDYAVHHAYESIEQVIRRIDRVINYAKIHGVVSIPGVESVGRAVAALEAQLKDLTPDLAEKYRDYATPIVKAQLVQRGRSIWWDVHDAMPYLFEPNQVRRDFVKVDMKMPPDKTLKAKRLSLADKYFKTSGWKRRIALYAASILTTAAVVFAPSAAGWAASQVQSLAQEFSDPTTSAFDMSKSFNKDVNSVANSKLKSMYEVRGREVPVMNLDLITLSEIKAAKSETNSAYKAYATSHSLRTWKTARSGLPLSTNEFHLRSTARIAPNDGVFAIPTPEGYDIKEIFFYEDFPDTLGPQFNDGRQLTSTKLFYSPELHMYWVEDPQNRLEGQKFDVLFERSKSQRYSDPGFLYLPMHSLDSAIEYLREAGFTQIVGALDPAKQDALIQGRNDSPKTEFDYLSAEFVENIFSSNSFYSFVPEGKPKKVSRGNPFKDVSRFAVAEGDYIAGAACLQCDGAADLLYQFLNYLYGIDSPAVPPVNVTIEKRLTYKLDPTNITRFTTAENDEGDSEAYKVGKLTAADAHAYVVIRDKHTGDRYNLDSTPVAHDPRNPDEQVPSDNFLSRVIRWLGSRSPSSNTKQASETDERPRSEDSWLTQFTRWASSIDFPELPDLPAIPEDSNPDKALIGRTRQEDAEELERVLRKMEEDSKAPEEAATESAEVTEVDITSNEKPNENKIAEPKLLIRRKDPRAESLKALRLKLVSDPNIQKMTSRDLRMGSPPAGALRISLYLIDYFEGVLTLEKLRSELSNLGVTFTSATATEESTLEDLTHHMSLETARLEKFKEMGLRENAKPQHKIFAFERSYQLIKLLYSALREKDFNPPVGARMPCKSMASELARNAP